MPVTHFNLQWPDASRTRCYSPSSVVTGYLEAGRSYPLDEFLRIARLALEDASERVRAKYGFACSQAMDQLAAIEEMALQHASKPDAQVLVTKFD